jgi:PKD repeat protein
MRRITKVSVLVIMVSVLGVFLAMAPGKVNAGMCVGETHSFGCGDTVTESCTFDGNITCSEGNGLIIGADSITIDGNDYCINGVDPGSCDSMPPRSGIFNCTYDYVVIKNLKVKNFCNGIWLYGNPGENDEVYKNTIENCNIHDNGNENKVAQGIGLDYVYDSIIKKNNIHHNIGCFGAPPGGCGINLCGGDRNKIIENILTDNYGSGMFIRCRPEYTEVYYNYVTRNLFGGIRLMCLATAYSIVEYNYLEENETHGITVGGPHNTIQYNISINNLDTTHDAPAIGGAPPFGYGILFCRSADYNEANFNTACGNEHSDIEDSTFSQTNSGKSNACDNAENWDDNGTTGCMYACDARPVAGFSGKPVSGPVPLKVQFCDESIGIINTWSWDFDDGVTSHERNPVHIYNDTGKYTVRLTVSGDGGTDTETKPAYINVTAIYAEFFLRLNSPTTPHPRGVIS